MVVELVIALVLAAVCAGGWLSAEAELRRTYRDLDVALGWEETAAPEPPVYLTSLIVDRDDV